MGQILWDNLHIVEDYRLFLFAKVILVLKNCERSKFGERCILNYFYSFMIVSVTYISWI